MRNGPLETVKAALRAYVDKDRALIERLIADDYHFTSPLDNAIDRDTYFERCWPNSEGTTPLTYIDGAERDDVAWNIYEGKHGGKRFRNCEYHRVRNGQLVETEVYFGWDLPHKAELGGYVSETKGGTENRSQ